MHAEEVLASELANDAANEAWRLVAQLFMRRAGRAADVANSYGLTPGHMKTLLTIEPDEPKPMGALAETLHCDASNATWLVDRLEERGYVERQAHPTDRRVRTVALTPEGIKVRDEIESKLYEAPPEFSALAGAELDALCATLRKVTPAD
ncbi:MAG: MarR family transcriptional regulator [Actinomycetia bacterium]|nr:MarR family transcriptional regulator [Actinomycetes bacterium]